MLKFEYKDSEFIFKSAISGNQEAKDALGEMSYNGKTIPVLEEGFAKNVEIHVLLSKMGHKNIWKEIRDAIKAKIVLETGAGESIERKMIVWLERIIFHEIKEMNWEGLKDLIKFDGNIDYYKGVRTICQTGIKRELAANSETIGSLYGMIQTFEIFLEEDEAVKRVLKIDPVKNEKDLDLIVDWGQSLVVNVSHVHGVRALDWIKENLGRVKRHDRLLSIIEKMMDNGELLSAKLFFEYAKNLDKKEYKFFKNSVGDMMDNSETDVLSSVMDSHTTEISEEDLSRFNSVSGFNDLRQSLIKEGMNCVRGRKIITEQEDLTAEGFFWILYNNHNDSKIAIELKNRLQECFPWIDMDKVKELMSKKLSDTKDGYGSKEGIALVESGMLKFFDISVKKKNIVGVKSL